jgi:hypothetical protein
MMRAKFMLARYETSLDYGSKKELRTLHFQPVSSGSKENEKFFAYTPCGSVSIGTVNPEAWKHFELGKEYYLDFTPATEAK